MRENPKHELANLESNSRWRLRDSDKNLYYELRNDVEAWAAFVKLTTGPKSIPAIILLLNLGSEYCRSNWADWDGWKDKWMGLASAVVSLRLVADKITKHAAKSDRGPIPLPVMARCDIGNEEYFESHKVEGRLQDICETLTKAADEIERFGAMRQNWLRRVPRRDAIGREQIVLFMRFIKERTGGWHFEHVAALLNVGRKLNRQRPLSGDALRKLRHFRTPFLDQFADKSGNF